MAANRVVDRRQGSASEKEEELNDQEDCSHRIFNPYLSRTDMRADVSPARIAS